MKYYRMLIVIIVSVLTTAANAGEIYLRSSVGDWQSVVDSAPKNATFIIESGLHRNRRIVPRDGDTFIGEVIGEERAKMSGAIVLKEEWTEQDEGSSLWFHNLKKTLEPGETIEPGLKHGHCIGTDSVEESLYPDSGPAYPCVFPQELFVTKSGSEQPTVLQRVRTEGGLNQSGTWYLHYGKQIVYLRLDDFNKDEDMVELSKTSFAFGYDVLEESAGPYQPDWVFGEPLPSDPSADLDVYDDNNWYAYKPKNVTIRNLVIEMYANPAQTGAIGYHRPGLDWIIEDNELRYNHGVGIKFNGAAVVRRNYVHHNLQLGIGGGDGNTLEEQGGELEEWGYFGGYCGENGLVEDNEIAYNGPPDVGANGAGATWGIQPLWEAGATKFGQCFNLTVRNNDVHDNYGSALWSDFSYGGQIYESNVIKDNKQEGIFVEVTLDSTEVMCNKADNNGGYGSLDEEGEADETITDAQIFVRNSPSVDVHHNAVIVNSGFGNGITVEDRSDNKKTPMGDTVITHRVVPPVNPIDEEGEKGGNEIFAENTYVHDNAIQFQSEGGKCSFSNSDSNPTGNGISGGQIDDNLPDFEEYRNIFYDSRNNTFEKNQYYVNNKDGCYWRWSVFTDTNNSITNVNTGMRDQGDPFPSHLTWNEWQTYAQQDNAGLLEQVGPEVIDPAVNFRSCPKPGLRVEAGTKPSPAYNEPDLHGRKGILQQLYGLENLARISNHVDQVWINHGEGLLTVKATFTNRGRTIGYFDANDVFHELLTVGTSQDLSEEGIGFGTLPPAEQLPAFRWGIDPPFSSQPGDNADHADHMLTWLVTDGPSKDNYVIAWEDFDDFDYNDLVVEISNTAPLKQTPIFPTTGPGETSLLGEAGVLDRLYGLENLRRIEDDDDQLWSTFGPNGRGVATAAFATVFPTFSTDRDDEPILVVESRGFEPSTSGDGLLPLGLMRLELNSASKSFSSQPSRNPDGKDHMVSYLITGSDRRNVAGDIIGTNKVGNYVIAWEDSTDQDFQDLVVELDLDGGAPNEIVNESIILDSIVSVEFDETPVPGGPAGTFAISANFKNDTKQEIKLPTAQVVALSGGNQVISKVQTIPADATTPSGRLCDLQPKGQRGDSLNLRFEIGLKERTPFSLFIDYFSLSAPPDADFPC